MFPEYYTYSENLIFMHTWMHFEFIRYKIYKYLHILLQARYQNKTMRQSANAVWTSILTWKAVFDAFHLIVNIPCSEPNLNYFPLIFNDLICWQY